MGYQDDLDDTWGDLAPDKPEGRSRWPIYLAIGAAVIVLLCICSVGGYLAYQEFLVTPEPTPVLEVPTSESPDEAGSEGSDETIPTADPETNETPVSPPRRK